MASEAVSVLLLETKLGLKLGSSREDQRFNYKLNSQINKVRYCALKYLWQ